MVLLAEIPVGWVIAMWAINLIVSIGLGVGMFFLTQRTRRIESLESRLEEKAEALVEAQIAAKTGELSGAMRELAGEIKRINQRLEDGDGSIEKLGEKGTQLEVALKAQTSE